MTIFTGSQLFPVQRTNLLRGTSRERDRNGEMDEDDAIKRLLRLTMIVACRLAEIRSLPLYG